VPKFQGDLQSVASPWGSPQLGGKIPILPRFRFLYGVGIGDYSEFFGPGWHLSSRQAENVFGRTSQVLTAAVVLVMAGVLLRSTPHMT
jgi:hypothetical protein